MSVHWMCWKGNPPPLATPRMPPPSALPPQRRLRRGEPAQGHCAAHVLQPAPARRAAGHQDPAGQRPQAALVQGRGGAGRGQEWAGGLRLLLTAAPPHRHGALPPIPGAAIFNALSHSPPCPPPPCPPPPYPPPFAGGQGHGGPHHLHALAAAQAPGGKWGRGCWGRGLGAAHPWPERAIAHRHLPPRPQAHGTAARHHGYGTPTASVPNLIGHSLSALSLLLPPSWFGLVWAGVYHPPSASPPRRRPAARCPGATSPTRSACSHTGGGRRGAAGRGGRGLGGGQGGNRSRSRYRGVVKGWEAAGGHVLPV